MHSHNIAQMERLLLDICWQFFGKIQPLVNEGAQVGQDGENIGRVTNPLLPPNMHLRASQYADLIMMSVDYMISHGDEEIQPG